MVENVIKCKWSLTVFSLVRDGTNRGGVLDAVAALQNDLPPPKV